MQLNKVKLVYFLIEAPARVGVSDLLRELINYIIFEMQIANCSNPELLAFQQINYII